MKEYMFNVEKGNCLFCRKSIGHLLIGFPLYHYKKKNFILEFYVNKKGDITDGNIWICSKCWKIFVRLYNKFQEKRR